MQYASHRGFSTLVATLLTAFLIALTAGILSLFLGEWRINRTLYEGMASYAAAEGGVEYALLKVKKHASGFQDALDFSYTEAGGLKKTDDKRPAKIAYTIEASWKNWSGDIAPSGFEIIPLSVDPGRVISGSEPKWKSSKTTPSTIITHTSGFFLKPSGEIVWNLLAFDALGNTDGIVGTGGTAFSVGNDTRASVKSGTMKKMGDSELSESAKDTGSLLNSPLYKEAYLVIYNPNTASGVSYTIESPEEFSFPSMRIVGKGKVGTSTTYLELKENKSKYFDALKYSLYNN